MRINTGTLLLSAVVLTVMGCTQETQNKLGRAMQNWTGTNGVIEIYSGGVLVRRFMQIDKMTTASGTDTGVPRAYRFGYGHLDANLDGKIDDSERTKVYFEVSDYSTQYVFYENPN